MPPLRALLLPLIVTASISAAQQLQPFTLLPPSPPAPVTVPTFAELQKQLDKNWEDVRWSLFSDQQKMAAQYHDSQRELERAAAEMEKNSQDSMKAFARSAQQTPSLESLSVPPKSMDLTDSLPTELRAQLNRFTESIGNPSKHPLINPKPIQGLPTYYFENLTPRYAWEVLTLQKPPRMPEGMQMPQLGLPVFKAITLPPPPPALRLPEIKLPELPKLELPQAPSLVNSGATIARTDEVARVINKVGVKTN